MSTLLMIAVCVLVAGFFSGSETGAYRLNRVRLRHQADSGSLGARMLQQVVANMERFVCLTLIGTNVSVYAATGFLTSLLARHYGKAAWAELAGTMILAPVLLVFADLLPKSTFQAVPNRLMRWTGPALWVVEKVCRPLTLLLYGMVSTWRRWLGGGREMRRIEVSARHFDFLLSEGREEGTITAQQDLMVRNIMQLGERRVGAAMIPLAEARMLPGEASGAEAVAMIGRHDHPRLPVHEGKRENVAGVLLVLDYLSAGATGEVREHMRPAMRLGEDLALDRAFRRLQEAGQTMGIVANEKGEAVGIVTTGDLLQEMFASLDEA